MYMYLGSSANTKTLIDIRNVAIGGVTTRSPLSVEIGYAMTAWLSIE